LNASTILIVEDDWLVANGLRDMLRSAVLRVAGIAFRREQVEALVREHAPDLALVDIHLGRGSDGIEIASTLLIPAGVRVVFASAHADDATLARARGVSAHGFVVKPFSEKQLRAAIEIALAAPAPALPRPDGALAADEIALRLRSDARLASLTERERAILLELLQHRRVPAIAEYLEISAHTVRNHLKAVFAKLRVSSQQELLDQILVRPAAPASEPGADPANQRAPSNNS